MPPPAAPLRRLLVLLSILALVCVVEGCLVLDAPLLRLRSVAGGIHNRRRAVGITPFFLPDGRMGCAANGALFVEDRAGGTLRLLLPQRFEVDDPTAAPDGRSVLVVAGGDQITAGGGHNDHVFQIYRIDLEAENPAEGGWTRITHSRRAETLPRFLPGGGRIVFVRRVDYEPYALYHSPWGKGAIVVADADGGHERRLTAPLFHPFRGLAVVEGGATVVFGAADAEGGYALYTLPLVEGGEPSLLVADAFLPAPLPGERGLVFVRGHRGEAPRGDTAHGTFDLCVAFAEEGEERVLAAGRGEILAVAVAPGGDRVLFTEFVPGEGQFGTYVLWEVPLAGGEPMRRESAPFRGDHRFKVGDLVEPVTWWGRSSRFSPGSR